MIVGPLNDGQCLGAITEVVAEMAGQQDDVLRDLAARFDTTEEHRRSLERRRVGVRDERQGREREGEQSGAAEYASVKGRVPLEPVTGPASAPWRFGTA